ncbi:MAG: hypothetical protein WA919_27215 [Coleofasciculaceae cyanobacterium]
MLNSPEILSRNYLSSQDKNEVINVGKINKSFSPENDWQSIIQTMIISLQYNERDFLTFKVTDTGWGRILQLGLGAIALQCQIKGVTYTFYPRHLGNMSETERQSLFIHLGLNNK